MKKCLLAVFILLFSLSNSQAQNKNAFTSTLNKVTTNDDYNYIAINQMKMWIGNNGMGSYNPFNDWQGGLFWPGGESSSLGMAYVDGLFWVGKVNNEFRSNASAYRYGFQAGKILNHGLADDPTLPQYRIYKIRKDWDKLPSGPTKDQYRKDYEEWPGNEGAPFYDSNNDGVYTTRIDKPLFLGDEVLWCVMNDLDSERVEFSTGSLPVGIEIQITLFGFNSTNVLKDVVFKTYKIINKSNDVLDSMYIGYWSDALLGYALDNYGGCDTTLKLGYFYNADDTDENYYESNPPALGYMFVQTPYLISEISDSGMAFGNWRSGIKNIPLNSFSLEYTFSSWIDDPWLGTNPFVFQTLGPNLSLTLFRIAKGLIWDDTGFINPVTNQITRFVCSGDPVKKEGWYEGDGWPEYHPEKSERAMTMTVGPITMAPGDTQEVVIAIIASQGSDNLQSITELKNTARTVQYFYDNYIPETVNVNYLPPLPEYYYLGQNYPNPFNPTTRISYELPLSGLVTLKVFDILGREISTLVNEEKEAGKYQVDFSSSSLSSGIYFYTLTSREYSKTKKMILIR